MPKKKINFCPNCKVNLKIAGIYSTEDVTMKYGMKWFQGKGKNAMKSFDYNGASKEDEWNGDTRKFFCEDCDTELEANKDFRCHCED